jgi:hypothetical protein
MAALWQTKPPECLARPEVFERLQISGGHCDLGLLARRGGPEGFGQLGGSRLPSSHSPQVRAGGLGCGAERKPNHFATPREFGCGASLVLPRGTLKPGSDWRVGNASSSAWLPEDRQVAIFAQSKKKERTAPLGVSAPMAAPRRG